MKDGDLQRFLHFKKGLPENIAAEIMSQIFAGIAHFHSNDIVHRDLKLENIVLHCKEKSLEVKIINFSHACYIKPGIFKKKLYGTLGYMAPEML